MDVNVPKIKREVQCTGSSHTPQPYGIVMKSNRLGQNVVYMKSDWDRTKERGIGASMIVSRYIFLKQKKIIQEARGLGALLDKMGDNYHIKLDNIEI